MKSEIEIKDKLEELQKSITTTDKWHYQFGYLDALRWVLGLT